MLYWHIYFNAVFLPAYFSQYGAEKAAAKSYSIILILV